MNKSSAGITIERCEAAAKHARITKTQNDQFAKRRIAEKIRKRSRRKEKEAAEVMTSILKNVSNLTQVMLGFQMSKFRMSDEMFKNGEEVREVQLRLARLQKSIPEEVERLKTRMSEVMRTIQEGETKISEFMRTIQEEKAQRQVTQTVQQESDSDSESEGYCVRSPWSKDSSNSDEYTGSSEYLDSTSDSKKYADTNSNSDSEKHSDAEGDREKYSDSNKNPKKIQVRAPAVRKVQTKIQTVADRKKKKQVRQEFLKKNISKEPNKENIDSGVKAFNFYIEQ